MSEGTRRRIPPAATMVAPVVVGLAARLAWVTAFTRSPPHPLSDPASYLRIAVEFSAGGTPTLGRIHTAFFPPGYPMMLAPIAWLSRHTGVFSLEYGAALLNAAAGTITIVLVGVIARQWFSRSAQLTAMWLMALAPGHIYYTSVAMSDVAFIPTALLPAALTTWIVSRHRTGATRDRWFLLVGLLIGFSVLVRNPGLVLLAFPALAMRRIDGSWKGTLRVTGATAIGVIVVLAPWAVRNGVQVGVWTPFGTNGAHVLCLGHRDGADASFQMSLAEAEDCTRDSPWDNEELEANYGPAAPAGWEAGTPDEARWYRRHTLRALGWAITHPVRELQLTAVKLFDELGGDHTGGFEAARGFGTAEIAGPLASRVYDAAANFWHWLVLGLAALAAIRLPSARRVWPLWAVLGVWLVMSVLGPDSLARYFYPSHPFVVVFAAGAIASMGRAVPDSGPGIGAPAGDHGGTGATQGMLRARIRGDGGVRDR